MTHPIMNTPNPVARIKARVKELQAECDADFKQWAGKLDSMPPATVASLEAKNDEIDELLVLYKEATAKEGNMTANRQNLQNIFNGNGGNLPTGDGDLARKSSGSGLAAAFLEQGWNLSSQPSAIIDMKAVYPDSDSYSPRRVETIVRHGTDERFLFSYLQTQNVGDDTSVEYFRQTGARTVVGSIERDIDEVTDKATLDVSLARVTESLKTLAVVIEDIPTVVLSSLSGVEQFFNVEAAYQINRALDTHAYNQIIVANPPNGLVGTNLFEQSRNAIAAMRLLGSSPTHLVVNPTDSASLDLMQDAELRYYYGGPQQPGAPTLWGLSVVERTSAALNEVPLVLDRNRVGILFLGTMKMLADPFTKMKKNLVDIRFEITALMAVQDANGAYLIEPTV